MRSFYLRAASLLFLLASTEAFLATIRNDVSRLDTNGSIIDCHSGMILAGDGEYLMYGERYENNTGFGPSPPLMFPKIVVYSSIDMQVWSFRGYAINDWPTKPYGTFFTPWVTYNEASGLFVLWFNAYLHGCCTGNWGVATSVDGISFDIVSLNETGAYAVVDCNGLFIDDDGQGYNIYTSEAQDHHVSIELMNSSFTGLAGGWCRRDLDLGLVQAVLE